MYLNLQGDEVPAEKEENETVREETIALSYKEDIMGWLQKCLASVALVPTIRGTLVQYKNLVKKLVGKSLNGEEIMEMKELFLKNPEYMLVFAEEQEALKEAFTQATKHIQQKFVIMLANKLREEGYNFPSPDFEDSNEFDFGAECVLLSC